MVRAVDRRYTFWLAGYYDDFLSARVVPDDKNTPGPNWRSSKSHHGNPINGFASLNPRYTYAWCERGDGASAQFNNAALSTTERYKFNSGMSAWLIFDAANKRPLPATWLNQIPDYRIRWHDLPQLQYPDSLTTANRQKFDGGTGILGGGTKAYETDTTKDNYSAVEGYMLMCNGYDTSKKYYIATGSNDSTFGRAGSWAFDKDDGGGNLEPEAGMPVSSGTTIMTNTCFVVRTHMTGVYAGEVPYNDAQGPSYSTLPKAILAPIESPCGKPFLVSEIYQNPSNVSYDPIISYDGTLNSKGDGDTFIIRICPMAVDTSNAKIRLFIGCEGAAFTSVASPNLTDSGDSGYSNAAIQYEITPTAFQENANGVYANAGADALWDDYEFQIDYSAYTVKIIKNGTSLSTTPMSNKADGTRFTAADMYGWQLEAKKAAKKLTVLIDRVGLVRYLNDDPYTGTSATDPVATSFNTTQGVNQISTMKLSLIDDDAELKLLPFFSQNTYSDWSLLAFRDRIDRPIWRGILSGMTVSQTTDYTPKVDIIAKDYFSEMDRQLPTWEVGQSGEGDQTAQVAYNRNESQSNLNGYNFGASVLENANASLSYNEVDDGDGVFVEHIDSRMRKRSAHPIQIYLDEDTQGPNDAVADWQAAINAGHATSSAEYRVMQTSWMGDLQKSLWFRHMFGKISKCPVWVGTTMTDYTVGTSTTLDLNGGFAINQPIGINGASFEITHPDGFVDTGVFDSVSAVSYSTGDSTTSPGYKMEIVEAVTVQVTGCSTPRLTIVDKKYYIDVYLPSPTANTLSGKIVNISGMTSADAGLAELVNGNWRVGPAIDVPKNAAGDSTWPSYLTDTHGNSMYHKRLYRADTCSGDVGAGAKQFYVNSNPTSISGIRPAGELPNNPGWLLPPLQNSNGQNFTGFREGGIKGTDVSVPNTSNTVQYTAYQTIRKLSGTMQIVWKSRLNMPTTNFLQRDIPTGSEVRIRNIDTSDFKHMWVIWSDMRNNGEADSDAQERRKSFGLMTPYASNYTISLAFADEDVSSTEERQQFTDLKIAEEVDLWEMDATSEPITGEPWSYRSSSTWISTTLNGAVTAKATTITLASAADFSTSGSGIIGNLRDTFTWTGKSGNDLTGCSGIKYDVPTGKPVRQRSIFNDWEDKGGSFVLVDTSKFFNLNTTSNEGKTGQASGGKKEIGDYLVETEGFPILIDNYWAKAPTTPKNLADSASWNPNYKHLLNDITTLLSEVRIDDPIIQLNDLYAMYIADPIVVGYGQIRSVKKKTILHMAYYGTDELYELGNAAVVAQNNGAGSVRLSAGNFSGEPTRTTSLLAYKASELYRDGHMIIIEDSTTSPSIDGEYIVTSSTGFGTTESFTIDIDVGVTISSGTCTVKSKSLKIYTLKSLGVPVKDTTAVGEWDGTAYIPTGGVNNNSAEYLIAQNPFLGGLGSSKLKSYIDVPIDPEDTNSYDDALVYSSLSNIWPMRLMMQINGYIENKANTTWYDSDKIRVTWLDTLTSNWLTQSTLYGIPDITSVPNTHRMNNTHKTANGEGRGGKIKDVAVPSGSLTTIETEARHGLVAGDRIQAVECVPLNSIMILDKEWKEFTVDSIVDDVTFKIINSDFITSGSAPAYGYYQGWWRKVGVVDDYGGVNDCRNVSLMNIISSTQSLSGQGYGGGTTTFSWFMGRDSKPSYRPNYSMGIILNRDNLTQSNMSTQSTKQITNVRVFYGGNSSFADYPTPNLGETPRWEIIHQPTVVSKAEALDIAKNEYEKYKKSPLSITANLVNWDNNNNMGKTGSLMLSEARYGYIADQSRTIARTYAIGSGSYTEDKSWAWTSLWGGNLFPGTVSALDGRDGDALTPTSAIPNDENYYWYGANSLGYATQVTHIPRGMPKVSQKTPTGSKINADGKLRIAIEVGNGVDYSASPAAGAERQIWAVQTFDENPQFTIRLLDYDWTNGSMVASIRSSTSVTVDSNGYYEIDIPSTYWSSGRDGNERIILSVNYDYLKSVSMRRCGNNVFAAVTQSPLDLTSASAQHCYEGSVLLPPNISFLSADLNGTKDLFPLGMRRFGHSNMGYSNVRAEWYAPRLHVCDDINFVPATTVVYSDSTLGLEAEVMGIKSVGWSVTGQQREKLTLSLERDVGRNPKGFSSLLNPPTSKGRVQGETSSSNSTPTRPDVQATPVGGLDGYKGTPGAGAWNKSVWGDSSAGTTQGSQLNVNSLLGTGRPGGLEISNAFQLSTNNLSNNTNKKIKGTMEFNNDSVTGGSFSVLGQKKPSAAPRNETGMEGIDSFISPSGGDATMSSNGMSFGGATDATSAYNEFTATARVPSNASSNRVKVTGRYTLGGSSGEAYFDVLVTCDETGATYVRQVELVRAQNSNIVLFEGLVDGLGVSGNTIRVTVGRNAGTSPDTAQYSAVTLHNIQIVTDRRSVSGASDSNQLSYSA
jgi:hypothetical protein